MRQNVSAIVFASIMLSGVAYAQVVPPANADAAARGGAPGPTGGFGRGGGWMTTRGDAQRSGSIRTDAYLSAATIAKPGFGLEWKRKVDNAPRQSISLTQGVSGNGSTLNPPP